MSDEQMCPKCNQSVESGALFCGNCGYELSTSQPATIGQVYSNGPGAKVTPLLSTQAMATTNVPAYAIPRSHHKQHWVVMALAFGVLGIGAAALIPILGISFGICGIVLMTSSYRLTHGWLKPASLVACIIAVTVGLGLVVNNISHNKALHSAANNVATTNGVSTVNVNTPCYNLSFNSVLNVNNIRGSCSMNAYNGTSFQASTNVYKVIASQSTSVSSSNFDSVTKQAIESDIAKNLSTFKITSQSSDTFDGSPAYYIDAYDGSANAAVIEEAIYHEDISTANKDNIFVIVHAVVGQNVNLNLLERSWQWND